MAPTNGSAKARKPGGNKTTKGTSKPVLPAIPLPFVKRRAAAEAAASAAASTPSTAASNPVDSASPPSNKPRNEKKLANGVTPSHEAHEKAGSSASPELDVTGPQVEKGPEMHDAVTQSANDQDAPGTYHLDSPCNSSHRSTSYVYSFLCFQTAIDHPQEGECC